MGGGGTRTEGRRFKQKKTERKTEEFNVFSNLKYCCVNKSETSLKS